LTRIPLIQLGNILFALSAQGDIMHDTNLIVGERAQSFGGAFTALANDASASHYNPAGLAFLEKRSLNGSVASYYMRKKTFSNIFGSKPYEENSVGALQSFFGAASKFGASNFAGGFSIYSPDVGLSEESTDYSSEAAGDTLLSYKRNQSQRSQSILATASLAVRMVSSFAIGASLGYSRDDLYYVSNQTAKLREPNSLLRYTLTSTKYNYLFESLVWSFGIRWEIAKKSSLGFRYQRSHLNLQRFSFLQDSTSFQKEINSLGEEATPSQESNAAVQSLSYSEKSSDPITRPHENFRFGFAQKFGRTATASADVSYSTKNSSSHRFFSRKAIVNAAAGLEWVPKGKFVLGVGGYSNFDAAKEGEVLSDASRGEYVNLFGATAVFGVKTKGSTYGVAYQRSEGIGKAQKILGRESSFFAQEHIVTLNVSQYL
jgi:hypothetical protein